MRANQATWPVRILCRLLKVCPSGYYAWCARALSAHAQEDLELAAFIEEIFEHSSGTYGAPRIHAELREAYGKRVGRKRVERLMREAHLQGAHPRRFRATTHSGAEKPAIPDLVERCFVADRPNALWLADVTYVPTDEGFLYLAVLLDVFSRLIVGWAMQVRLTSALVLEALTMAYRQRSPEEVIHHSDHGTEFTAVAFSRRCEALGIQQSMGSVGDCFDNAMMESFFASLEREVLDRQHFATREEARREIFSWIEGWYNPHRRHSGIGYLSPREFEEHFSQQRRSTCHPDSLLPASAGRLRCVKDRKREKIRDKRR